MYKHITNTADDDQRESDDKANTSIPSAPITHSRVINGDSNGDSETTAPTPAATTAVTTAVTTAETTTEDASKIEVCPNYKWARCPLWYLPLQTSLTMPVMVGHWSVSLRMEVQVQPPTPLQPKYPKSPVPQCQLQVFSPHQNHTTKEGRTTQ